MGVQTQKTSLRPAAFIAPPNFGKLCLTRNGLQATGPLKIKTERDSVVTMSIASHGFSKEDKKYLRNENLYLT